MTISELINIIKNGGFDTAFKALYKNASAGRERALALCDSFIDNFGDMEDAALFSAPGRTELIGNHTDHNGGQAVGAAIDRDILALAAPFDGAVMICEGDSFTEVKLDSETEKGSSAALAAGMARRFGGGFCAVTHSLIPVGKGLSSSAAFSLQFTAEVHLCIPKRCCTFIVFRCRSLRFGTGCLLRSSSQRT